MKEIFQEIEKKKYKGVQNFYTFINKLKIYKKFPWTSGYKLEGINYYCCKSHQWINFSFSKEIIEYININLPNNNIFVKSLFSSKNYDLDKIFIFFDIQKADKNNVICNGIIINKKIYDNMIFELLVNLVFDYYTL